MSDTPMNGSDTIEQVAAAAVNEPVAEPEQGPGGRGAPVFEIIIPSSLVGVTVPAYHFKIWADGFIDGFRNMGSDRIMIVNRLPLAFANVLAPLRTYLDECDAMVDSIRAEGGGHG